MAAAGMMPSGAEWPGDLAFELDDTPTRVYATPALNQLLVRYIMPIVERVEEDGRVTEPNPGLALQVYTQYKRVRPLLLRTPQSHVKMAPEQRLALISLFIATVQMLCQEDFSAHFIMGFQYMAALKTVAKLPLALGPRVTKTHLRDWTVSSFMASLRQFTTALEECGATLPGAEECWRAHWSALRYLLILDADPPPGTAASTSVPPPPAGLSDETLASMQALGLDLGRGDNPLWVSPSRLKRTAQARFDDEDYCTGAEDEVGIRLRLPLPYGSAALL
jgi:hypothetical protein